MRPAGSSRRSGPRSGLTLSRYATNWGVTPAAWAIWRLNPRRIGFVKKRYAAVSRHLRQRRGAAAASSGKEQSRNDAARAIALLQRTDSLNHRTYNVSSGRATTNAEVIARSRMSSQAQRSICPPAEPSRGTTSTSADSATTPGTNPLYDTDTVSTPRRWQISTLGVIVGVSESENGLVVGSHVLLLWLAASCDDVAPQRSSARLQTRSEPHHRQARTPIDEPKGTCSKRHSTIPGGSHSAFCGLKQTPTRLRSTGRPAPLVRSVQGVPPWLKSGSNERHASTAALGLRPSILWTHRETWRVPRAHRSVRLGKSATLRMLAGIETGRSRPHRLRFDRASRSYGTIETSPATRGTHGRWWRSTWASR